MGVPKKDIRIETMRGTGEGGQNKNKRETAVRVTHLPTGITAYVDGRNQGQNKKKALAMLEQRLAEREAHQKAQHKKARRDEAIHNLITVRTYHYGRGTVKDHRTGKTASLKEVMGKGRIDLLK